MATVPGGLGVELGSCSGASFIYADIEWTPADAHVGGSPIGYRLATEQAHLLTMNNPTMNEPAVNNPTVSNPAVSNPSVSELAVSSVHEDTVVGDTLL